MNRQTLIASIVLIAGTSAWAESPYTVVDLGRLPDAFSTVPLAINSNGEVVGWCQGPGANTRAFLYTAGGGIQEIIAPAGHDYNVARDISDNGIIVGHAKIGILGTEHAWRLQNGQLQMLGSLQPNGFSEAYGCNNDGTVVGRSNGGGFTGNPFVYTDEDGMVELATTGNEGIAHRINNAGQVAGYGIAPGGTYQAYLWSEGAMQLLGALDASHPFTYGLAINDLGQIGGTALTASGFSSVAFVHTPGGGYTTLPSQHQFDEVSGINDAGVAVGFSGNTAGVATIAWIWSVQGGLQRFSTFMDPADGYDIRRPLGINDNGQIIAIAVQTFPPNEQRAVLLTPVLTPTPGDLNGDQLVDESDRAMFCGAMGTSLGDAAYLVEADLNNDETIDHLDLQMFNDMLPLCGADIVSSRTFAPPADGKTDAADLAYLLGAWGAQPSCADFVSSRTFAAPPDGVVDAADLAYLLGAWGVCP